MADARTIADLRWLSEAESYLTTVRRELEKGPDEELAWAEREVSGLVVKVRTRLALGEPTGTPLAPDHFPLPKASQFQ